MVPVSVEEIVSLRWEQGENHQIREELSLGEFTLEIHIRHPRGSCWRGVRTILEPGERSQGLPNPGNIANHGTGGGFWGAIDPVLSIAGFNPLEAGLTS